MSDTKPHQKPFRLFIGIEIPDKPRKVIRGALGAYQKQIENMIPEERWHMTLLWLGECAEPTDYLAAMGKPMPQQFLPTVTLTHVGRGLASHQVWAYSLSTPLLTALRTDLRARLQGVGLTMPGLAEKKPFVPHISIANFKPSAPASLPDELANVTFAVPAVHLYHSQLRKRQRQYTILTSMAL